MKPKDKLWMLLVFTGAWIAMWMMGPENPGDKYETWELVVFAAVLILCFWKSVSLYSRHVQQRDADRLKKVLKRRDARTDR